jgi:hypothetical protein
MSDHLGGEHFMTEENTAVTRSGITRETFIDMLEAQPGNIPIVQYKDVTDPAMKKEMDALLSQMDRLHDYFPAKIDNRASELQEDHRSIQSSDMPPKLKKMFTNSIQREMHQLNFLHQTGKEPDSAPSLLGQEGENARETLAPSLYNRQSERAQYMDAFGEGAFDKMGGSINNLFGEIDGLKHAFKAAGESHADLSLKGGMIAMDIFIEPDKEGNPIEKLNVEKINPDVVYDTMADPLALLKKRGRALKEVAVWAGLKDELHARFEKVYLPKAEAIGDPGYIKSVKESAEKIQDRIEGLVRLRDNLASSGKYIAQALGKAPPAETIKKAAAAKATPVAF